MNHRTNMTIKTAILVSLFSLCSMSLALVHSFNPDDGSVIFVAKGKPSLLKIEGKGSGFNGQLTEENGKVSGTLTMDVRSFDTGIELRDEHMKNNYLDVENFPTATLSLKDQAVPKEGSFKFKGELEIKGVPKTVEGTATLKKTDGGTELKAEFPINISNYPIGVPKYLGITVAETVQVTATSKSVTQDKTSARK